jgi:hypothetical protein
LVDDRRIVSVSFATGPLPSVGNQYPTTSTGTPLGMYAAAAAMSPDHAWWIQIWPLGTSV